jgi:hypothetical protein
MKLSFNVNIIRIKNNNIEIAKTIKFEKTKYGRMFNFFKINIKRKVNRTEEIIFKNKKTDEKSELIIPSNLGMKKIKHTINAV